VILVQLDSAAIQWTGQETLPGTTYKDKHNRRHYFHSNICNSIRSVIVIVIIIVDITVVDVIVIVFVVVVVLVLVLLLSLHISSSSSSPPPPPPSPPSSSLPPSYWSCTANGNADAPIQFQNGGLTSYRTTATVLPILRKTSGNDCKIWWKLYKENQKCHRVCEISSLGKRSLTCQWRPLRPKGQTGHFHPQGHLLTKFCDLLSCQMGQHCDFANSDWSKKKKKT
jgi:hypothetical protein